MRVYNNLQFRHVNFFALKVKSFKYMPSKIYILTMGGFKLRRKQLYAIILAGALATSGAPAAVFAAEGDVAATAETSEETPVDGEAAATTEAPAAETPAQDTTAATEAPAAETPAQDTAAATEAPAQETPEEQTQTAEETPTAETGETQEDGTETQTLAEGETTEETHISITLKATEEGAQDQVRYFDTIQHAINAAPKYDAETAKDATVIEVSGQIALDATVTVPADKKVCIRAKDAVTITRASDAFTDDMFEVTGENAELQFDVKEGAEGASFTVSGKISDEESDSVEGAIVSVGTGAAFGMDAGVTLKENNSTANGGAITNVGGNIVLKGGAITENNGAKGAVYSDSDIKVQGTVVVKENQPANIYLAGTSALVVSGAMTNSDISFTQEKAADKQVAVKSVENFAAADFKTAVGQIKYDTTDYTLALAENGLSATLQKKAAEATATPTPTPAPLTLKYKSGTLKWKDHTTVTLQMTTDGPCKWYYFFVDAGTDTTAIQNMYVAKDATNVMSTSGTFDVTAVKVPEKDSWLVVCAKPDSGAKAKMSVIKLNGSSFKKKRPAAATTVTTRAAKTYKVSESTVAGLSGELKFFPGKFYEFTVTGAGMDNTDPVQGDERWYPVYWSTKKNPTTEQQNTTWRIGSGKGIKDGATYNIYIFLKKQVYNGKEWEDASPQEIKYITGSNGKALTFTAASISDKEWNAYIAELSGTPTPDSDGSGSGGGDGSGSGDETDAELTATAAASEKDAGSKSKSAVSTADESPIGTMSALAALSLLAGGYIVVRKRKKEEL